MERSTRQRNIIRSIFEEIHRPLSPREIYHLAKSQAPTLGIATVYRNIKTMVQEGYLTSVEIPGQAPRYERSGKKHHHHFFCRQCERVYEIEGCPVTNPQAPNGFTLESHHLILHGVCQDCNRLS